MVSISNGVNGRGGCRRCMLFFLYALSPFIVNVESGLYARPLKLNNGPEVWNFTAILANKYELLMTFVY